MVRALGDVQRLRFLNPVMESEFMRALEQQLVKRNVTVELDIVGHSMGSLVLVNAFRVMSDYFRPPDDPT